jgi:hypothetical protein
LNEDGLCAAHAGKLDMRELGRRSGEARKRRKAGGFREAIRRKLESDPDVYAEKLLASGAKGLELADRFIAEEDEREAKREAGPLRDPASGRAIVGFPDLVAFACAREDEGATARLLLGFMPSDEQRREAIARWQSRG